DHLHEGEARDELRRRTLVRVRGIDPLDLRRLHGEVGLHLDRPDARRRVGRKVRAPRTTRKDDDPPPLEVAQRTAPNVRLGELLHPDRRHHARLDTLPLEQVLQRERIDDRGQHPHVIGADPIHPLLAGLGPTDDVPAPDHQRERDAHLMNGLDLLRQPVDDRWGDPEPLLSGQRLPAQLQENASVPKLVPFIQSTLSAHASAPVRAPASHSPSAYLTKRRTTMFSPVRADTSVINSPTVLSGSFTKAWSRSAFS